MNDSHVIGFAHKFPYDFKTNPFLIPCYLLPIEGADVVLGLDWLSTLGQVFTNFATPSLCFIYQNLSITLSENSHSTLQHTSYNQLTHLFHTYAITTCHILSIIPLPNGINFQSTTSPPSPTDLTTLPLEIQTILLSLPDLFLTPKELPPKRPHDHHFNLFLNTKPVNVRPYRYPHHRKATVAKLITKMLYEGIIKPIHSPFSSLVLLIKKKDGTWRLCVDYRALNAVNIKDRFPIPIVDALLDELGNAKFFTKLDLQSGYH